MTGYSDVITPPKETHLAGVCQIFAPSDFLTFVLVTLVRLY
jgi:hypothetical protein